jgi:hypothetical protein
MAMKAMVTLVERDEKNNIVYLEDLSNTTGSVTITNDAENVLIWCREIYGFEVRIVYKDTDNEWWEIVPERTNRLGVDVGFKRWNGLAWDILQR